MESLQRDTEPGMAKIQPPMSPPDTDGVISIYDTHQEAEAAVKRLQRSGFDMKKLSIVGRDFQTEENVVGFYNIGDRAKYWGKLGAFWGGLWGLLFGFAMFIIPGIGPLVIAGAFVSTLVGAVEGVVLVGGLSALGAALFSIGIPRNSIVQYETALKGGRYVMIANGSAEDLHKAREIVENTGAKNVTLFNTKDGFKHEVGMPH